MSATISITPASIFILALRGRPSERLTLLMIVVGPALAFLWRALGWHEQYYEGMPGIAAGLAVYFLARCRRAPAPAGKPSSSALASAPRD